MYVSEQKDNNDDLTENASNLTYLRVLVFSKLQQCSFKEIQMISYIRFIAGVFILTSNAAKKT